MSNNTISEAAASGNIDQLKKCIKDGNIASTDSDGMTPLHWASYYGQDEAIAFLLQNDAPINVTDCDGLNPYDWAIRNEHHETSQLIKLKKAADEIGWPFINYLALHNAYKLVWYYINHSNINTADKEFGRIPLHWAVYHSAMGQGDELLNILLKDKNLFLDFKDSENGRTPLIMAAFFNDSKTVKALLTKSPDLNIADDSYGYTALHWAIERENISIAKILIANGSNIDIKDNNGVTQLDLAKLKNNESLINLLKETSQFDECILSLLSYINNNKNTKFDNRHEWDKISDNLLMQKLDRSLKESIINYSTNLIKSLSSLNSASTDKIENEIQRKLELLKESTQIISSPSLTNNSHNQIYLDRFKSFIRRIHND